MSIVNVSNGVYLLICIYAEDSPSTLRRTVSGSVIASDVYGPIAIVDTARVGGSGSDAMFIYYNSTEGKITYKRFDAYATGTEFKTAGRWYSLQIQ